MKYKDPDVQLAHDCLTETLHGPLPIATSMRLAETVLRLEKCRQQLVLPSDELDALRNIVHGAQWCLHCQDEVEVGPVSGICPECGEESVPMVGRDFLMELYERLKKASE